MRRSHRRLLASACFLFVASPAAAAVYYPNSAVTQISISGVDINDNGQVVGGSSLWENGTVTALGDLGGAFTQANAINNSGQVVGQSQTPAGPTAARHAFLWAAGTMTDLGTLGGTNSEATSINDSGEVVGWSDIAGDAARHAFLWSSGVMTDLGTLPGGTHSRAAGINNSGEVVGMASPDDVVRHAVLWVGGTIIDLGTLGGGYSEAADNNNSGEVVGWSTLPGDAVTHAFVWANGVMTDLGTLGGTASFAGRINDNGQIVGSSFLAKGDEGPNRYAVIWQKGLIFNLSALVGRFSTAWSINASGQVVSGSHLLTPSTIPPLDHYMCDKAAPNRAAGGTSFDNANLPARLLEDRFGSETCRFKKENFICPPAEEDDGPPTNPTIHQVSYGLTCPTALAPITGIQLFDAFNPIGVTVTLTKKVNVLVPSGKTDLGPIPPPPPQTPPSAPSALIVDHYLCYKVKGGPIFNRPAVTDPVKDQFYPAGYPGLAAYKMTKLCTPVNKATEDPTAPSHAGQLTCYLARMSFGTLFGKTYVVTNNTNFGANVLKVTKTGEYCVPAVIQ